MSEYNNTEELLVDDIVNYTKTKLTNFLILNNKHKQSYEKLKSEIMKLSIVDDFMEEYNTLKVMNNLDMITKITL